MASKVTLDACLRQKWNVIMLERKILYGTHYRLQYYGRAKYKDSWPDVGVSTELESTERMEDTLLPVKNEYV
jgi:hypothetical protein